MTRRLVSPKDANGAYEPPEPLTGSLEDVLNRQMSALELVTRQLLQCAKSGVMTKDEIQSLATCIKVTMELKAKQKELLDALPLEELEKLAQESDDQSESRR